jgi:hypothetical protein
MNGGVEFYMLVISDRLGSKHMNLERIPCTSDSVGEVKLVPKRQISTSVFFLVKLYQTRPPFLEHRKAV